MKNASPGFIGNLYSIQHSYLIKNVGTREKPILGCDAVIEIPVIASLPQEKTIMGGDTFNVVPCIEILGLSDIKFLFETNEGMTVMPIEIDSGERDPVNNPYTRNRIVLVLPCGTTGIKSCKTISVYGDGVGVQHSLTFGIMPPPYNYDNALFAFTASEVRVNHYDISDLDNRVVDLEDKTVNLKLVTNSPYFPSKKLPKGEGRQTINIENGMLYFHTVLNFLNINGDKTMNLIITLNNGVNDKSYTLALSKGYEAVLVDLVAGGIFVYLPQTGEVLKELRINPMTSAYKTISYEGFDAILLNELVVTISGRKIA